MAFWNRGVVEFGDVAGMAEGSLELRQFVVGMLSTNCYALVSEGHAVVVDPGAEGALVAEALGDVTLDLVVATHGHADHVGGVKALVDATGAPFAMSAPDVEMARHAKHNGAFGIRYDDDAPEPSQLLSEGDVLSVGAASLSVLAAPGHTPGGIVLVGQGAAEGVAFMGDTLFAGSAGRTDLVGGDADVLMETLHRLAGEIAPATHLLCGHGDDTTMRWELASNPFLR